MILQMVHIEFWIVDYKFMHSKTSFTLYSQFDLNSKSSLHVTGALLFIQVLVTSFSFFLLPILTMSKCKPQSIA